MYDYRDHDECYDFFRENPLSDESAECSRVVHRTDTRRRRTRKRRRRTESQAKQNETKKENNVKRAGRLEYYMYPVFTGGISPLSTSVDAAASSIKSIDESEIIPSMIKPQIIDIMVESTPRFVRSRLNRLELDPTLSGHIFIPKENVIKPAYTDFTYMQQNIRLVNFKWEVIWIMPESKRSCDGNRTRLMTLCKYRSAQTELHSRSEIRDLRDDATTVITNYGAVMVLDPYLRLLRAEEKHPVLTKCHEMLHPDNRSEADVKLWNFRTFKAIKYDEDLESDKQLYFYKRNISITKHRLAKDERIYRCLAEARRTLKINEEQVRSDDKLKIEEEEKIREAEEEKEKEEYMFDFKDVEEKVMKVKKKQRIKGRLLTLNERIVDRTQQLYIDLLDKCLQNISPFFIVDQWAVDSLDEYMILREEIRTLQLKAQSEDKRMLEVSAALPAEILYDPDFVWLFSTPESFLYLVAETVLEENKRIILSDSDPDEDSTISETSTSSGEWLDGLYTDDEHNIEEYDKIYDLAKTCEAYVRFCSNQQSQQTITVEELERMRPKSLREEIERAILMPVKLLKLTVLYMIIKPSYKIRRRLTYQRISAKTAWKTLQARIRHCILRFGRGCKNYFKATKLYDRVKPMFVIIAKLKRRRKKRKGKTGRRPSSISEAGLSDNTTISYNDDTDETMLKLCTCKTDKDGIKKCPCHKSKIKNPTIRNQTHYAEIIYDDIFYDKDSEDVPGQPPGSDSSCFYQFTRETEMKFSSSSDENSDVLRQISVSFKADVHHEQNDEKVKTFDESSGENDQQIEKQDHSKEMEETELKISQEEMEQRWKTKDDRTKLMDNLKENTSEMQLKVFEKELQSQFDENLVDRLLNNQIKGYTYINTKDIIKNIWKSIKLKFKKKKKSNEEDQVEAKIETKKVQWRRKEFITFDDCEVLSDIIEEVKEVLDPCDDEDYYYGDDVYYTDEEMTEIKRKKDEIKKKKKIAKHEKMMRKIELEEEKRDEENEKKMAKQRVKEARYSERKKKKILLKKEKMKKKRIEKCKKQRKKEMMKMKRKIESEYCGVYDPAIHKVEKKKKKKSKRQIKKEIIARRRKIKMIEKEPKDEDRAKEELELQMTICLLYEFSNENLALARDRCFRNPKFDSEEGPGCFLTAHYKIVLKMICKSKCIVYEPVQARLKPIMSLISKWCKYLRHGRLVLLVEMAVNMSDKIWFAAPYLAEAIARRRINSRQTLADFMNAIQENYKVTEDEFVDRITFSDSIENTELLEHAYRVMFTKLYKLVRDMMTYDFVCKTENEETNFHETELDDDNEGLETLRTETNGERKKVYGLPRKVKYLVAFVALVAFRSGSLDKLPMLATLIADGFINTATQALGALEILHSGHEDVDMPILKQFCGSQLQYIFKIKLDQTTGEPL